MKILLINPPSKIDNMFGIGSALVQKYEPLGLLYIAAAARQKGYDVKVIDCFAENMGLEELKIKISAIDPDVIGITTLTCNGSIVFELGKWLKSAHPEILVVLGNIHASEFAKQYLENKCCDIVVNGEGEYVFLKIIELNSGKYKKSDIKGISYLDQNGNIVISSDYNIIDNITELPLPARDLVKPKLYKFTSLSNQLYMGGRDSAVKIMVTSRGCPNKCSFCAIDHNNKPRFNDPIKVVDEIEFLKKEYNISYIYFEDSLFIANKQRILKICSEINRRKIDILWGIQGHVNYITKDIIKPLEDAGCYDMALGIESGVQRLLDKINKQTRLEKITEVVNMVKANSKILLEGLFILGLPTETYDESLKTIEFAKRLNIDMAQFSIFTPYPGSQLFNELKNEGKIDTGIRSDGSVDTSVWEKYSAYISFTDVAPIWITPALTLKQLRNLQKKAQRSFYLRPAIIKRNIKRLNINNVVTAFKILMKGFF
jgi:magnesium-protoporphyrin IX monomethyl ester (oxidative) cyclase